MKREDFIVSTLGKASLPSPVVGQAFVSDDETVCYDTDAKHIAEYVRNNKDIPAFERAGARETIFHDPAWSRAAILTAGGLCPGLN